MNLLLVYYILCSAFINLSLTCGQKYVQHQKLTVIQLQQQHSRILTNNQMHPLQMYGHFPSTTNTNIDINILRTLFGISAKYYSNVIQVIALPSSATIYPISSGPCGITVPSIFIKKGFDQTQMDMVIFIIIESKSSANYIAAAAPCIKVRRPVYGFIIFNAAHITTSYTLPATFHQNIYVTLHQLTHILGFNNLYYNMYYASPTSSIALPINSVIKNINNRSMIITPTVLNYVQKYFNCNDNTTGALLQNQGGSGSVDSHWQRLVYLNQMMTASDWQSGLRITGLTLSLLKDTNFYQFVDISQGEIVYWGSGKGCQFALAQIENTPQFCLTTDNIIFCDFYNQYLGYCTNKDNYGDNSIYIKAYSKSICTYPQYQLNAGVPSSINNYIVFSDQSHCFQSPSLSSSVCYQANCLQNNSINITINGLNQICTFQNQIIQISGISIICPINFTVFCASKVCPNWCNNRGLCIKGKCICNPPWSGVGCENGCGTQYFDESQQICVKKCSNTQFLYNNSICTKNCPSGYINNSLNECILCDIVCLVAQLWNIHASLWIIGIFMHLIN